MVCKSYVLETKPKYFKFIYERYGNFYAPLIHIIEHLKMYFCFPRTTILYSIFHVCQLVTGNNCTCTNNDTALLRFCAMVHAPQVAQSTLLYGMLTCNFILR